MKIRSGFFERTCYLAAQFKPKLTFRMKQFLLIGALCFLFSCNTLYVSQSKSHANMPSLGVEWNFGDFPNETLQHKLDSAITQEISQYNAEKHAFTIYKRERRDKSKDYITLDLVKGKVVGTGGKIAGYSATAIGLIATPVTLVALESPLIVAFYYWPNHQITSKITLSSNLSGEKKNNKNLMVMTGALFSSTGKQNDKLVKKYVDGFHKTLLDIEAQLSRHQ